MEGPVRASVRADSVPILSGLRGLTGAERLFWEASERALRHARQWVVVVLHLSRLSPPAPRPHHVRVARVLLQDAAVRFGGQVFAMRNQDLVLLCMRSRLLPARPEPPWITEDPVTRRPHGAEERDLSPEVLPATMARLFSADVPDGNGLTSFWRLDSQAAALLAYLEDRAAIADECLPEVAGDPVAGEGSFSLAGLRDALARTPMAELLVRQTGMSLGSDRSKSLADRLTPAFCALEVSFAAFAKARPGMAGPPNDPAVLRHLASDLDRRLIASLADDLGGKGRLFRAASGSGRRLPIHLDLSLDAILSPAFARLCRQAALEGVGFGVVVPVMQACADLDLMDHARQVVKLLGGALILGAVEPAALGLIAPALLEPDLLKLTWSSALPAGSPVSLGRSLTTGIDLSRVVLSGVTSQAALAWGQSRGITLFQGPFLDQVQAAGRMARCDVAHLCTLRQCGDRAAVLSGSGRAGCANPAQLDGCEARLHG